MTPHWPSPSQPLFDIVCGICIPASVGPRAVVLLSSLPLLIIVLSLSPLAPTIFHAWSHSQWQEQVLGLHHHSLILICAPCPCHPVFLSLFHCGPLSSPSPLLLSGPGPGIVVPLLLAPWFIIDHPWPCKQGFTGLWVLGCPSLLQGLGACFCHHRYHQKRPFHVWPGKRGMSSSGRYEARMSLNSWVHSLTWQEQNFGTIPGNNNQAARMNKATYQLK